MAVNKKSGSTTIDSKKSRFALIMASSSDDAPIVYSEDTWDIVKDGTKLATIIGDTGQYDQHTINELLAKGSSGGSGGAHQYELIFPTSGNAPYGVTFENNTLTISSEIHGCEGTPFVTCYQDNAIVDFAVSKNTNNDVIVSWNGIGVVTEQHPVTICIMGGTEKVMPNFSISEAVAGDVLQVGYGGEIIAAPLAANIKQYVFVCKNYANTNSTTILGTAHGCGTFPIVTCYSKTTNNNVITHEVVETKVTTNILGDITITWQENNYVSASKPLYISIVGVPTNVVEEQNNGNNNEEPNNEEPINQNNNDITEPDNNETYTVRFLSENGDVYWEEDIEVGNNISQPEVYKEGYEFAGWNPSVPNTMPASNLTFVAQWQIRQYTLTLTYKVIGDGGYIDEVTDDISVDYNAIVEEHIPEIDYFLDEASNQGGTGYIYTFSEWNPALPYRMPAEDVSAIAQYDREWQENEPLEEPIDEPTDEPTDEPIDEPIDEP